MAEKVINWEAKEHLEYKHDGAWYGIFALAVIVLSGFAIFVKEWTFLVLIIVAAIALLFYVRRPARDLHYSLSAKGLTEGNKLYNLSEYRSFGILNEDNHYSIVLTPKKRFATRLTVFFPESQGEEIVDMFGARLPMEPVRLDFLDRLVKILRI